MALGVADGRLLVVAAREEPREGRTQALPRTLGRRLSAWGARSVIDFRQAHLIGFRQAHLHGHPQYSMTGQTKETAAGTRRARITKKIYAEVEMLGASLKGARACAAYAAVGMIAEKGPSTWGWMLFTSFTMREVICFADKAVGIRGMCTVASKPLSSSLCTHIVFETCDNDGCC